MPSSAAGCVMAMACATQASTVFTVQCNYKAGPHGMASKHEECPLSVDPSWSPRHHTYNIYTYIHTHHSRGYKCSYLVSCDE